MPKQADTPLLLLPGLLCDRTIWAEQLEAFARYKATVADYGDARTIQDMARRALASAPAQFSLAGHSMGARVALEILRLAPDRVERLALFGTGVHTVRAGEAEKRYALRDLGRREGMDALIAAWLPPMVQASRRCDRSLMDPLRAMCLRAGLASYEAQIEALLNRPDPGPTLKMIACPTLIGVGDQDEWSPVEQHREIAAAIPGSRLVVIENSGHMAPIEAPDQVNRALQQWLDLPYQRKDGTNEQS